VFLQGRIGWEVLSQRMDRIGWKARWRCGFDHSFGFWGVCVREVVVVLWEIATLCSQWGGFATGGRGAALGLRSVAVYTEWIR